MSKLLAPFKNWWEGQRERHLFILGTLSFISFSMVMWAIVFFFFLDGAQVEDLEHPRLSYVFYQDLRAPQKLNDHLIQLETFFLELTGIHSQRFLLLSTQVHGLVLPALFSPLDHFDDTSQPLQEDVKLS